jgi:hypothetical protein
MKKHLLLLLLPIAVFGQTEPVGDKLESSISGVVLAAGSGLPLPDATVSTNRAPRDQVSAKTDSQGH